MILTRLAGHVASIAKVQILRAWGALCDPVFYAVCLLGTVAWFTPLPPIHITWKWLLVKAFYEEFLFRFLIQEALDRVFGRRFHFGPVSLANLIASVGFAAMHVPNQGFYNAVLIFFPSLVFGWMWDRYKSVFPPAFIHFFFNYCHFYRLGVKKYIPLLPHLF